MDENTKEILDILHHLLQHSVTKSDLAEFRNELSEHRTEFVGFRAEMSEFRVDANRHFSDIERELGQITKRLDRLEADVADIRGYAKELDELRLRVRAVEKHLGLERKIAA